MVAYSYPRQRRGERSRASHTRKAPVRIAAPAEGERKGLVPDTAGPRARRARRNELDCPLFPSLQVNVPSPDVS